MSATPKKLWQGQPATTATSEYTVPASTTTIIKNIVLCNTSASSANVTIYVVSSGGTAGTINAIINSYNVDANDTVVVDMAMAMSTGDFISLSQGTINAITVTISGVELA